MLFLSLRLQRLVEDIEYVDLCHKAAGELSPFMGKLWLFLLATLRVIIDYRSFGWCVCVFIFYFPVWQHFHILSLSLSLSLSLHSCYDHPQTSSLPCSSVLFIFCYNSGKVCVDSWYTLCKLCLTTHSLSTIVVDSSLQFININTKWPHTVNILHIWY